jgi:gamma-glutamylcyclotransferase (GGCT)/AIG2-like uncharacterized protein YtfP
MKNLFAYGTLLCEDIMHKVSGDLPAHEPALLHNYASRRVSGQSFPAIYSDRTSSVPGTVYFGVTQKAWLNLDRFEGDMYDRTSVEVMLTNGTMVKAETYVVKPEFRNQLSRNKWNLDRFICNDKRLFLEKIEQYPQ